MTLKKTEFITISSFLGLPPVKNYIEYFEKKSEIIVVQNIIENFEYFFYNAKQHKVIKKYKSSTEFNSQNFLNKVYKYFFVLKYFIVSTILNKYYKSERTIYTIDIFSLLTAILLKSKWDKIIYHEYEIIEKENLNYLDKLIHFLLRKNVHKIDLIIIPEINRANYFKKIIPFIKSSQILIIPNTNNNKLDYFKNNNGKITITHIGSIGLNHHIVPFMNSIILLPENSYEILFVGLLDINVKNIISSYSLKNVQIINQLNHNELEEIYKKTDIGVILYKDVGLNYKFCAPNKLYEFWSYGIPVVGDILPGLISLKFKKEMGTLVNMEDSIEISSAIKNFKLIDKFQISFIFHSNYSFNNFINELNKKLNYI